MIATEKYFTAKPSWTTVPLSGWLGVIMRILTSYGPEPEFAVRQWCYSKFTMPYDVS